ncbi:hypothetical protein [Mucilaginibacter celer]|uniref:GLPGLI family protein n=1 Tax=Mucilaginibacter celer TaxID=2305508 RepID=A0A494VYM3_9SPHI|nr:hypothetical protein [Mucilaginibacter celer]AYL99231.1 hypothetical protein HYN43_029940 [Mucilaginibacter celer]
MKTFKFIIVFFCCFYSANLFAQTPQAIEADLLRIFKRVNYYGSHKKEWKAIDSLQKMNKIFGFKLKYYTSKYPETISYPFTEIKKERVVIATSADGLFRTYSWDTRLGSVGYDFDNVLQFTANGKVLSSLKMDSVGKKHNPVFWYSKIYTLQSGSKTYYLAAYNSVRSSVDATQGVQFFAIENGKLNGAVLLVKTPTGLHSKIYFDYDFLSVVNMNVIPTIYYDTKTQTIHSPLVNAKRQVTRDYIVYKFTGKYFERVKN